MTCRSAVGHTVSGDANAQVRAVLILAGIFHLVLVFIFIKIIISLSHILVIFSFFHHFHSFSLILVDEKPLHFRQLLFITFSQTSVTNIYFGSYFICSIQIKIFINSSLFRPNQLNLWEIWIKDWIWKNWNSFSFFGRDTNETPFSTTVGLLNKYTFI